MKYIVTKTYKYTVVVEVEAESASEARELAYEAEGDHQNDDWLYDASARVVE